MGFPERCGGFICLVGDRGCYPPMANIGDVCPVTKATAVTA